MKKYFKYFKNFRFFTIILGLFIWLFTPFSVYAFEIKAGESITVSKDQEINGSLFTSGNNIIISGTVNGDLFCVAQNISIDGVITGDVLCAGQTLTINGQVKGDVRAATQTIQIDAIIDKNITALSQSVNITDNSDIKGEIQTAAQTVNINGNVSGGVIAASQKLLINSTIGNDVHAAVENFVLGPNTNINGKINYVSTNEVAIESGATISGIVKRSEPPANEDTIKPWSLKPDLIPKPIKNSNKYMVLFWIGLVMLLSLLIPKYFKKTNGILDTGLGNPLVIGLLSVIFAPLIFLILIVTIIGIPLVLIVFPLWVFLLFATRVLVGVYMGERLTRQFNLTWGLPVISALGVFILWMLMRIPVLGGFINIIAALLGFGTFILSIGKKPGLKK